MTWIMIITIFWQNAPTVTTVEFASSSACEQASTAWKIAVDARNRGSYYTAICVPKS